MVAGQAAAAPNAPAVVAKGETTTYAEVDRRANQLGNYLVELGVTRETIVGICLDRSPESIVSALSVMKAGGAFLPLDPAYPTERLLFMLEDARPHVLITRAQFAEKLSGGAWQTLSIDGDPNIESHSTTAPIIEIDPDQLAYVIYTSGSTGLPKGVEITHASLSNLIRWHRREFAVTPSDRATHLASVGFDAAVWEIWPYLTAGASLHLPNEATRVSPELLRDWLVAEEITISFLPTILAERVMALDWPAQTALRFLLIGSDTLHSYPAGNLSFEVVNNYGPTECTVVATSGRLQPHNTPKSLPTIGRPITNTAVYIVDENLEQVPTGVAGELCIGGAGVARGYLNRPDLTREKFIPDRFSVEPGARMYRTGDRARFLEDSQIAYLGRIDEQIKIRGHRIEPSEIEAVLNRHPAIESSVVVAKGSADEKLLAAYVAPNNGAIPAALELRSFLQNDIPAYMLPSIFIRLDRLPVTPNGKVDRNALPEPNIDNTLRDEPFVAARTPVEKRVAAILSPLLNLDEVSVNDNFFLLGGHSLLGTQLIARIRSAFGVDMTLRSLFDSPTIAGLSREIERLILACVESMSEEEATRLLA